MIVKRNFFQNAKDRSGGPYLYKQNGSFTRPSSQRSQIRWWWGPGFEASFFSACILTECACQFLLLQWRTPAMKYFCFFTLGCKCHDDYCLRERGGRRRENNFEGSVEKDMLNSSDTYEKEMEKENTHTHTHIQVPKQVDCDLCRFSKLLLFFFSFGRMAVID